jgi:hypothetical protein
MRHAGSGSEDVEVAIVGTDPEPGVSRAVRLIEHFLHTVFVPVDAENDWSLLGLVP